jgi:Mrp family chromosome partitioning ATPase
MSNCNTCPSSGSCNKPQEDCGINNNPANHIKHVIGVMSGKGGVGKSSLSVLITKKLAALGYKVGILDADITGPSVPRLLHLNKERAMSDGDCLLPVETKEGIKVMSLNFLIEDETSPVVWRGPMIGGAIKQFWEEVLWGELDYLIIDMPPGTGDVPLTVGQSIPVSGMVIVSTKQDFVSMIVTKSVHMVEKLGIPILGVIENMSYIACPDCNKKITLFEGTDTTHTLDALNLDKLGELPMVSSINNLSNEQYSHHEDSLTLITPIVEKILAKL